VKKILTYFIKKIYFLFFHILFLFTVVAEQSKNTKTTKDFVTGEPMRKLVREEMTSALAASGVGGPQATVHAQTNALLANMQTQMTALQQMQTQMNNVQNVSANETALNVSHGYVHADSTRQVPLDFELKKTSVITAWRFWNLGNRRAGKSQKPVWPYKKLTSADFKEANRAEGLLSWRSTSKVFSKWRRVLNYLSEELTDSDTHARKWEVDGPTHYLTLNRLSKLIPRKVSKYSTDPCHNSVSTVYNILCQQSM